MRRFKERIERKYLNYNTREREWEYEVDRNTTVLVYSTKGDLNIKDLDDESSLIWEVIRNGEFINSSDPIYGTVENVIEDAINSEFL